MSVIEIGWIVIVCVGVLWVIYIMWCVFAVQYHRKEENGWYVGELGHKDFARHALLNYITFGMYQFSRSHLTSKGKIYRDRFLRGITYGVPTLVAAAFIMLVLSSLK